MTGLFEAITRHNQGTLLLAAAVAVAAVVAVASYAEGGASSNTLVITPRVAPAGTGPGGVAVAVDEINENFSTHRKANKEIKGVVLARLDAGSDPGPRNLVIDMLWTNSIDVTGPLSKSDALLRVGLFFLDADQQRAKVNGYTGDCDDQTQREFKLGGVKTYVCPDPAAGAHGFMNKFVADKVLRSDFAAGGPLFLLADIPKTPKPNETIETSGSESVGQVKKQKFHVAPISI